MDIHKLVILERLDEKYIDRLNQMAPGWEIICNKDYSAFLPHLGDAEILSGWNEHAVSECLKQGTPLRWIHFWGAGVNTLPLEELKKRSIILTNSSGVHAWPISETVFAMMLSLTRKIHRYIGNQIKQEWSIEKTPLEMHGRTIGILGLGDIGMEIARLSKAFGMKVLGYRRSGQPVPGVDIMYECNRQGLNNLLSQSDYVVNALPLTKETKRLMGMEQFEIMKQTAFYINIGRGETTDTEAMVQALRENIIAGAGLDVFEQEPLPRESPLWELENVILTPHTSGMTEHYADRVMDIFIPDFQDYLNGNIPRINRIDLDREY